MRRECFVRPQCFSIRTFACLLSEFICVKGCAWCFRTICMCAFLCTFVFGNCQDEKLEPNLLFGCAYVYRSRFLAFFAKRYPEVRSAVLARSRIKLLVGSVQDRTPFEREDPRVSAESRAAQNAGAHVDHLRRFPALHRVSLLPSVCFFSLRKFFFPITRKFVILSE